MILFATRLLWAALSRAKKGRVIVLSTHSMDEADAISDRIGIMYAPLPEGPPSFKSVYLCERLSIGAFFYRSVFLSLRLSIEVYFYPLI